jgi:hypothetical protein
MHGDSDLYASRSNNFPTKHNFEKCSLRMTGMVDSVYYDKEDLAATYYIGVYGYQYSTFTLTVKIDREKEH